jgi:hypothetical protein
VGLINPEGSYTVGIQTDLRPIVLPDENGSFRLWLKQTHESQGRVIIVILGCKQLKMGVCVCQKQQEEGGEQPFGCCHPLSVCCGCGEKRFDAANNHCYNSIRSLVFGIHTVLWISFVILLQAGISATFDYLLDGKLRVIALWVGLVAVLIIAVLFTHLYTTVFDTTQSRQVHSRQHRAESLITKTTQKTMDHIGHG